MQELMAQRGMVIMIQYVCVLELHASAGCYLQYGHGLIQFYEWLGKSARLWTAKGSGGGKEVG